MLGLGALGVVFGDIGTSPLYSFKEVFGGPHPILPVESRVLGVASLFFWTLTLVVSVKYVLIVMRADNDGEGGIIALAWLAVSGAMKTRRRQMMLMGAGILGAGLFYGDGMITPAVSVMSAVEGLEIAEPGLSDWVVPIAVAVLVALFAVQRRGTGRIGKTFGPVMLVWFAAIAILGASSVWQTPEIIAAVNPMHAVDYFIQEPLVAFLTLDSVVLCVTGAEALYADMGQFGRGPIRLSWFTIACPALYLNYLGQAALVIREPSAAANPFYLLVPGSIQLPMVLLATAATVIASQSVISGAFSMTVQAIQLDYLPAMLVKHTSASERGQVYVPAVNWVLGIGVVLLVIIFQTSSNLASAYGIAVTGTFVITTCLITVVALQRWKVPPWIVWPGFVVFFVIDFAMFLANFTKFDQGGWLPLLIAFLIFAVLTTWRRGRMLMFDRLNKLEPPISEFARQSDEALDARRIPGAAVYLAEDRGRAPAALVRHVGLLSVLAETTVLLRLGTSRAPRVDPHERVHVERISAGFWSVSASYGFMEQPDVQEVMELAADAGLPVTPDACTFVLDLISVEPAKSAPMAMPRQRLYSVMQRVATDPTTYMNFPPDRILGVGTVVKL